jgi:hypothetical protein
MSKFIPTGTERKMCECERLYKKEHTCERCGKEKECDCDGLCPACRNFFLDECAKDFGID